MQQYNADYLYLLLFKDQEYFKLGISTVNGFDRVNALSSVYNIDFESSHYVVAEKGSTIRQLEAWLKLVLDYKVDKFEGKEGWTEIRLKSDLPKVFSIIDTMPDSLKVKVKSLKVLGEEAKRKEKEKKIKHRYNYLAIAKLIDGFKKTSPFIEDIEKRKELEYLLTLKEGHSIRYEDISMVLDIPLGKKGCAWVRYGCMSFTTLEETGQSKAKIILADPHTESRMPRTLSDVLSKANKKIIHLISCHDQCA